MIFHVWITAALPLKEGGIISDLVKKGYDISPAAEDQKLVLLPNDSLYAIFACKVEKSDVDTKSLYEDFSQILITHQIDYCSIIISEHSVMSIWGVGNIKNNRFLTNYAPKKIIN